MRSQVLNQNVAVTFSETEIQLTYYFLSVDHFNLLNYFVSTFSVSPIYTFLYGNPKDAVVRVSQQRPQADPNIEVIRLSDRLLNLNGQLLYPVEEMFYGSLIDVVDFN